MRTRRVLIALMILAVLAGWWWLSRPQEMRLVDIRQIAMPITDPHLETNVDFFLASDDYSAPPFIAMRWDGTVRWHIVPPKAVLPASCADYSRKFDRSLSPDGRFFTAVIVQGNNQKVMMWDEGEPLGSVSLPLTTIMRKGIPKPDTVLAKTTTLENGQVFCWIRNKPGASIILLDNGKIQARGKLPALSSMNPFSASWSISPDGQALIDAYTYYRIVIKGNALSFTPVYTAKDNVGKSFVTRDGFLVNDEGAVYNGRGRVSTATGWHLLVTPFVDTFTPRHATVMQVQTREIELFPFHLNGIRILDPRTGETWGPRKRGPYQLCQSSFDGRYLLAIETPADLPQSIFNWLREKRLMPDKLYFRLNDRKDKIHLYVYRKPGRLYARLSLAEDSDGFSVRNPRTGKWIGVWSFSLSEDGHTLHCLVKGYEESKGYTYSILTYKWR